MAGFGPCVLPTVTGGFSRMNVFSWRHAMESRLQPVAVVSNVAEKGESFGLMPGAGWNCPRMVLFEARADVA